MIHRWILLGLMLQATAAMAQPPPVEAFNTLDHWQPLTFPKIDRHTHYTIAIEGTNHYLKARSDRSASGLVGRHAFRVADTPRLRWRWRVAHLLDGADITRKETDDIALRLYVMFDYVPGSGSLAMRAKYSLAKRLYGEYPPHSTLSYVWASRPQEQRIITSPYTDQSRLIVMRVGDADIGQWLTEEVNILDDYRAAFGSEPPPQARLAIMSDSDNTAGAAEADLDDVSVLPPVYVPDANGR
ncbi:MAG: DUF3047 domain-containing protein [Verrucomicrobia bacterium]|nr:DUF3047 domain-containing protein [Verrucomicrobiota bacterium]